MLPLLIAKTIEFSQTGSIGFIKQVSHSLESSVYENFDVYSLSSAQKNAYNNISNPTM